MGKLLGRMADFMKANTLRIKRMGRGCFIGRMERSILGNGSRGNSMVREFIFRLVGNKRRGYGKMGSGLLGLIEKIYDLFFFFFVYLV